MSLSTRVLKSGQFAYSPVKAVYKGREDFTVKELPVPEAAPTSVKKTVLQQQAEDIINQAQLEAAELIRTARLEAESIVNSAKAHTEAWREKAEKEGRQKGYADGKQQAFSEAQSLLSETQSLLNKAVVKREELIRSVDQEIVGLAFSIARKVIDKEVSLDKGVILRTVRKAIKATEQRTNLCLKVCPADIEQLSKSNLLQLGLSDLKIIEDPQLRPGECIVDGYHGRIDASFEAQLSTIRRKLEVIAGG